MQHVATPKKAVKKVVRPTQADTNDKCRFCPFQFSVKYRNFGNSVRPSSESLYKISSNKEYNDTKTFVELCQELRFSVPRCSRFARLVEEISEELTTSITKLKVLYRKKATRRTKTWRHK